MGSRGGEVPKGVRVTLWGGGTAVALRDPDLASAWPDKEASRIENIKHLIECVRAGQSCGLGCPGLTLGPCTRGPEVRLGQDSTQNSENNLRPQPGRGARCLGPGVVGDPSAFTVLVALFF